LYIISSQKYDCAQPQQPPKGLVPKERAFYRAVLYRTVANVRFARSLI
jgi:hypothetical protein